MTGTTNQRPSTARRALWAIEDALEVVPKALWISFALAVIVGGFIVHATTDPTAGVDYLSGDEPEEMPRWMCFSDSGTCPPPGFRWSIPASEHVETYLRLDERNEFAELRGDLLLEASGQHARGRDCAAVVRWSLTADGVPVAQGALDAGGEPWELAGAPPSTSRTITFTAVRTDSLPCHSTLRWRWAGLR